VEKDYVQKYKNITNNFIIKNGDEKLSLRLRLKLTLMALQIQLQLKLLL